VSKEMKLTQLTKPTAQPRIGSPLAWKKPLAVRVPLDMVNSAGRRPHEDALPLGRLARLSLSVIGRSILYYPVLESTVDTAKGMAMAGVCEGTVVLAGQQTAGRGRMGRLWVSTPGSSILMSVILHPAVSQLAALNMLAGLAVVRTIERLGAVRAAIKWPNDVLLNGRKVCGILVENTFAAGELQASIVSPGLNVRLDVSPFSEIRDAATSLSSELRRDVSPEEVVPLLIKEMDRLYSDLQQGAPVFEQWLSRVETLGKRVTVRSGDSVEEGFAESILADGSLVLRRSDGSVVTVVTGE